MSEKKLFPIVGYSRRIPWEVAQEAYAIYSKRYGSGQTLERLAERGGFHQGEMDDFLPGWRERTDLVTILKEQIAALEAERDMLREAASGTLQTITKYTELYPDHSPGALLNCISVLRHAVRHSEGKGEER